MNKDSFLLLITLTLQLAQVNAGKTLDLERDARDTIHDNACSATSKSEGSDFVCTCKQQYSSVVSKQGLVWDCNTPQDVGCAHSLGGVNNTDVYVISRTNGTVSVTPALPNDTTIQKIFIWNGEPKWSLAAFGYHVVTRWDSVSDVAFERFELDNGGKNMLLRSLSITVWHGQLVKLDFGGGKCALAKFKGKILYPVDLAKFKKYVNETKIKPVTSTVRPKTTVKKDHHKTDNSQGQKISIIIGVVLFVAIVATVSIYCFRRHRKSSRRDAFSTEGTSRDIVVKNMHLDDKPVIMEDGTSFQGIEHTARKESSSSDNDEKVAEDGNTSTVMDLYSDAMEDSSSDDGGDVANDGNKSADDGNTSTVMDLYSDAMEESSSEEEIMGEGIDGVGKTADKQADNPEVTEQNGEVAKPGSS